MDWTLSDIKSKVRSLTGRPGTGALSDSALLDHINQYFRNVLPVEVDLEELRTWFSFVTSAADGGKYALHRDVLAVESPVTLEDSDGNVDRITFYSDAGTFFTDFPDSDNDPDDTDTHAEPTALLAWGRRLYLRPIPDGTYTVKFRARRRPFAILATGASSGTEFVNDTDYPEDYAWGPLIAYGAAIDILQDAGEDEEADRLKDLYVYHLNLLVRKQIGQIPIETRAAPRF